MTRTTKRRVVCVVSVVCENYEDYEDYENNGKKRFHALLSLYAIQNFNPARRNLPRIGVLRLHCIAHTPGVIM